MAENAQNEITTPDQFANNKAGLASRWMQELNAAQQAARDWLKRADVADDRFKGMVKKNQPSDAFDLNLFYSNVTTLRSMLFGKIPEITFDRKDYDFDDDVARVASIILTRMLQADIGTPNDQYSQSLRQNLDDRLIPGLGTSRVRYNFVSESVEVGATFDLDGNVLAEGFMQTNILEEKAPLDYVFYKNFLWSPCRTWADVRWVAFKSELTRDECSARFGKELGSKCPLTVGPKIDADGKSQTVEHDDESSDAWKRAEVWEIWNKSDKKVYWYCKGVGTILDVKDDPLKLSAFFPIPRPMIANVTSSAFMPTPDFHMARDLYNEIDKLEARISLITEAVKVVGLYDASQKDLERMLVEGIENDLIPVDNWAMFAEKGGINGVIEFWPIAEIANVLKELTARRNDAKAQLFEITGMSDIMRGAQAAGGAVSATERALEARFASVRVQALQDEFANFATDLIRLRAEVISKHFSVETIIKQSNIERTPDGQNPQLVMAAVQLIKNREDMVWRVGVKPESVSMVDYAQLKQERTEYLTALATYFQSFAPIAEQEPELKPLLLQLMNWGLAGFKGGNEVEGLVDKAVQDMEQDPGAGQEGADPTEMLKAQEAQAQRMHEQQMEMFKFNNQARLIQLKSGADMQEITHEANEEMRKIQANTMQDILKEEAQRDANMDEEAFETDQYRIRKNIDVDTARRMPTGG